MYRLIRVFASVLLTLTLVSCATGVKFTQLQPSMTPRSSEVGRIFFYRPSAFGAALRPDVLLNGEKVGEAISRGFFYVDRPPGEYQAVTSTEVKRKVSFVLEKGQTRFVRFSVSFGFFVGHVYGELVDQEVGLSEIQKCKYTGGETSGKPIQSFKSIAGKWEGSVQTWRGLERVTVTIEEDGSYSWDTPSGSAIGTMRVNDGKIRFRSSFYGPSGELTLQEREGERLLKITYDHLDWRGALKPAK